MSRVSVQQAKQGDNNPYKPCSPPSSSLATQKGIKCPGHCTDPGVPWETRSLTGSKQKCSGDRHQQWGWLGRKRRRGETVSEASWGQGALLVATVGERICAQGEEGHQIWTSRSGSKSQFCHLLVWHIQGPHHQPAFLNSKSPSKMEEDHRKQEEEGPPCTNCKRPRSRAYSATRRAAITTPLDVAHISNLRKLLENVLHQNNGGKKKMEQTKKEEDAGS